MSYISAIAVDFGSTNSGCCRVCDFDAEGNLVYSNPTFLHNDGSYAKDNTWLYIEPAFLERIRTDYDSLTDSDFRILSRIMPNTENPNIIWQREAIKNNGQKIKAEGWKGFQRFKMMLYNGDSNYASLNFPLLLIIKTYLRVLKLECLELESRRMGRPVTADEIQWGLTIPSIWSDDNKRVMVELAQEVFSSRARVLSEPEGPLVYSLYNTGTNGRVNFEEGRTTFVIDMGGGTTDICLMKEAQHGGTWRMEMIANTDGSAAGGNDIDKAFYTYLMRKISAGKKSDVGVAYDSLNDYDLLQTLFDGFQADVTSFIAFENNWMALKNRADLNSLTECPFTFTSEYRRWLMENGHKEVADQVRDYLIDGCQFPKDEFVEKVYGPTFDKITGKIKELLQSNAAQCRIDRIVPAGGLSCNPLIKSRIQQCVADVLGDEARGRIFDMGSLMAGGSIAAGACYMLLHKDFISRLARKNYYFDSFVDSVTEILIQRYAAFDMTLKRGEINTIMDDEDQYAITRNAGRSHLVLSPVAVKGKLVQPYVNEDLSTRPGQTTLSMEFYSTDGDIVIYANSDNPKLTVEAKAEFKCTENTNYKLEIDFNEAQISNALHYVLSDLSTNQVVAEGNLENAIATN